MEKYRLQTEVGVIFVINEQDSENRAVSAVGNSAERQFIKSRTSREDSLLEHVGRAHSKQAFERDLLRIGQMYYNDGYVKALVGRGQVELGPDDDKFLSQLPSMRAPVSKPRPGHHRRFPSKRRIDGAYEA